MPTPGRSGEEERNRYTVLTGNAAKAVGVVSARLGNWDTATTVTDFLSVSYDPPTVLVSLYSLSRMAEAVVASERWGLSLLAANQAAVAEVLGEEGAPLVGLLDRVPHFRREAASPVLIRGALSWFELKTVATHPAATHTLFVGEVTAMGSDAPGSAAPLVRFRSAYLR